MTDYFSDTFTDTDATELGDHVPDLGTSWALATFSSSELLIQSNRLTNPDFAGNLTIAGTPAPSDDYAVSGTVVVLNSRPFGVVRIGARWQSASDDYYWAEWNDGDQEWNLGKTIGFTATVLDSSASMPASVGVDRLLTLTVTGDDLVLLVDATPTCSATDSDNPTSGYGGVLVGGLVANELCLDNYSITDDAPSDPLVHSVSGRGNFAITGLNWLSTVIDSSGVPSTGNAEPPNYYHVGQLSWGTVNGAMVAYPVTRSADLVWIPSSMDTVWYSFAEGVSATITERSTP